MMNWNEQFIIRRRNTLEAPCSHYQIYRGMFSYRYVENIGIAHQRNVSNSSQEIAQLLKLFMMGNIILDYHSVMKPRTTIRNSNKWKLDSVSAISNTELDFSNRPSSQQCAKLILALHYLVLKAKSSKFIWHLHNFICIYLQWNKC